VKARVKTNRKLRIDRRIEEIYSNLDFANLN
jgi:hypothetical protein